MGERAQQSQQKWRQILAWLLLSSPCSLLVCWAISRFSLLQPSILPTEFAVLWQMYPWGTLCLLMIVSHVFGFIFCILPIIGQIRFVEKKPMKAYSIFGWALQLRLIFVIALGSAYLLTHNILVFLALLVFFMTIVIFMIFMVVLQC